MFVLKRLGIAVILVILIYLAGAASQARAIVPGASFSATPLEMNFGPIGVGSTSSQMVVTITNSGTVPLTGFTSSVVPAPFNVTQDCNVVGGVLPGNSCHYYFVFSPTSAGTFSATLTSSTNAGLITIIVHGTGVSAQASYDAHSLDVVGNFTTTSTFITNAGTFHVKMQGQGMSLYRTYLPATTK